MLRNWSIITYGVLEDTLRGFLMFLPKLIGALTIFVIGWFISVGIGRLVSEILKKLRFNQIFERNNWKEALEKAEIKVNPSDFTGGICKWILVIVSLFISVGILGFDQFADFLVQIIAWLPNLIIAIAIFVVSVITADILEKVIKAGVKKIGVGYAGFLGSAVRWSLYIFAGLAILRQLGVTPTIIDTLVMGFVGMITLAVGLSFGLGGKDAAARLIEDIRKKIS